MSFFDLLAVVISLTALMSVANERLFKLPAVLGPMSVALVVSLLLVGLKAIGFDFALTNVNEFLEGLDFSAVVLDGMLGFLLFAGAIHVPIKLLEQQHRIVLALAIITTCVSTAVVGTLLWWLAGWFDLPLNFMQALAFGALISPTDPVAVLALLKTTSLPKRLEVIISGESLFNDALGVILFLVIGGMAFGNQTFTMLEGAGLIAQEIVGGLLIGVLVGSLAYLLLEASSDQATHVLITLAVASGGYALALLLGTSGPIAMVIAGLIVGNYGLRNPDERDERRQVNLFWRISDDILNIVLFMLIGLQVLILPDPKFWLMSIAAVFIALIGRFIGVLAPTVMLKPHGSHYDHLWWDLVALLTWGGLRGGVSVALVLTLPKGEAGDLLLHMTFAIVVFSILIQGFTMGRLFDRPALKQMAERARDL